MLKKEFPASLDRGGGDTLIWFGSGSHNNSKVWNCLREKPGEVAWWKLVWFKGQEDDCVLCQRDKETEQHFFFKYSISAVV
ncbi:hypothetical protein LIER_24470 [Lithospermum erythrorhizon]|uniref:Uncharacterized protein n=1 Tax=Lithospermum erythrorhizon TaxID=34254 RepID=A0AAV3R2P9_LITER